MKRFFLILAAVIGLLIVIGAAVFAFTPKEKLLAYVTPEVDNIRVTDVRIGEEQATMHVQLDVLSKIIPVFIDSLSYDLRLYGRSVATGNQSFDKKTVKGKKQTLTLPMSMNHNRTRELVRRQVAENEPVETHLQIFADVPLFGRRRFDVNKKLDLIIPALPGMQLKDLSIHDFGLDTMKMTMVMLLDNPNEFDFFIRDMKFDMQMKDYMVTVGEISKDHLIKARSVTPIQLNAVSDVKKPLKTTFKTMTGDHVWPYSMKTAMVIEPKSEVIGTVHIDAVKAGEINVIKQVKEVLKTKKEKKQQEKAAKKEARKA